MKFPVNTRVRFLGYIGSDAGADEDVGKIGTVVGHTSFYNIVNHPTFTEYRFCDEELEAVDGDAE